LVIALLAGSPAALWLSQHLGWVYGGLTLLSFVSLGLGLRWLQQKSVSARRETRPAPAISDVQPITNELI
jgi:predicted MFS family arabinose efflux permease